MKPAISNCHEHHNSNRIIRNQVRDYAHYAKLKSSALPSNYCRSVDGTLKPNRDIRLIVITILRLKLQERRTAESLRDDFISRPSSTPGLNVHPIYENREVA